MKLFKTNLSLLAIVSLTIFLSGFTAFKENVPPPKDIPKRTQDKNAGIVIPSFDASPYDIIEKSYDPLDAFMRDPEKGTFMSLSTSNFDFNPHKFTFYHKKFGFVTHHAYRVNIAFTNGKKNQKMSNFAFSPFEISKPITKNEIIPIAESWVKFFDSQGWKRIKESTDLQYKIFPKENASPYMMWESDGFELTLSVMFNEFHSFDKNVPRYYLLIVFDPDPNSWRR
jgi:hypothetical protein